MNFQCFVSQVHSLHPTNASVFDVMPAPLPIFKKKTVDNDFLIRQVGKIERIGTNVVWRHTVHCP